MTPSHFRPLLDRPALLSGWALLAVIGGLLLHGEAALVALIALLPVTLRGAVTLLSPIKPVVIEASSSPFTTTLGLDPFVARELDRLASSLQAVTVQQGGDIGEHVRLSKQMARLADDVNSYAANSRRESVKLAAANAQTRATLNAGREALAATLISLAEVRASDSQLIGALTELAKYMRRIGQLVAAVNEIATQSNFLALNTAIEAARAETVVAVGGQGSGQAGGASFATVADEMRILADQSRGVVGQLRALLNETQIALTHASAVTEASVPPLDSSLNAAQQLENVIGKLSEALDNSVSAAHQIAVTADRESGGLETLAQAAESLEPLGERLRAELQLIDSAARDLARLANETTEKGEN